MPVVAAFASSYDVMKLRAMRRSVEVQGIAVALVRQSWSIGVCRRPEKRCVAEKKTAAFARRSGMQRWPRQVRRP